MMNEILTFSVIALVLVMSPGPNSVLIFKTVTARGVRGGMQNILGLFSATFCHGALSIFGLSALILQSAQLFMAVKIIGALYLLYLGVKTLHQALKKRAIATQIQAPATAKLKTGSASLQNISEGFFTQLLNPKVSMFYLAAFPQFVNFESINYLAAFSLVLIHASIIVVWFSGISLFISRIKAVASDSLLGRWAQSVSGAILVLFGGLLLTHEAR